MALDATSTCAEAGATPGGALPDPMGVVELLFRGHSIADMAEAAGMPVVAIVRALSEHDFEHLRHLHKALVLGREFKIERLRLEAAEKLAQMAAALLDDHPKGLTPDQVRATDAQRRAILSILRLPAFPCLADGRADMRPPTNSRASSSTSAAAADSGSPGWRPQGSDAGASDPDHGDDEDQPWRLYNQILSKRLSLAMTEVMGRGRAGAPGAATSSAPSSSSSSDAGAASSDAGAAGGSGDEHDPGSSLAAAEPVSAAPAIQLSDETGEAGISGAAASGMAGGRTGQGLPMGLNRAARRRWLREQRAPNKRHSRPPP